MAVEPLRRLEGCGDSVRCPGDSACVCGRGECASERVRVLPMSSPRCRAALGYGLGCDFGTSRMSRRVVACEGDVCDVMLSFGVVARVFCVSALITSPP